MTQSRNKKRKLNDQLLFASPDLVEVPNQDHLDDPNSDQDESTDFMESIYQSYKNKLPLDWSKDQAKAFLIRTIDWERTYNETIIQVCVNGDIVYESEGFKS